MDRGKGLPNLYLDTELPRFSSGSSKTGSGWSEHSFELFRLRPALEVLSAETVSYVKRSCYEVGGTGIPRGPSGEMSLFPTVGKRGLPTNKEF